MNNIKGQIWVETVVYTLIGLALIAIVLAFTTPKLTESKEMATIEQSIELMKIFSNKIDDLVASGSGSRIIIPAVSLKQGQLVISPNNKTFYLYLENLNVLYSSNGTELSFDNVYLTTTKGQKYNSVVMKFNITNELIYANNVDDKVFSASATPYKFSIDNTWDSVSNKVKVNIKEISS